MSDPIFSVVIPAFNRASSISNAVYSVLEQTEQNFEIIIIDDGSTDNTHEVVAKLIGIDARIKYFYQSNSGAPAARNNGISKSCGKYIAFLDSDDQFLPFHLENSYKEICKNTNICTYSQVIVDRGAGLSFLKPNRAIRPDEEISDYLLVHKGFIQTSTLVVPRKLLENVIYDVGLKYGQDIDIAIRLAKAGAVFIMLSKPVAVWNDQWSDNRVSSKIDPFARIEWLEKVKPDITTKSYYSVLGKSVAKGFAQNGLKTRAFKLYLTALFHGGFTVKSAIVYFFQISLNKQQYRSFSDFLAKLGFRP